MSKGQFAAFLASIPILIFFLQLIASERIEVVDLHTLDENMEEVSTRLWVTDDDGYQYLRAGADGSEWFTRLKLRETLDLTRNNRRYTYAWVLREDKSQKINQLMHEKYGWGDSFIGLITGGRENSIPIELRITN